MFASISLSEVLGNPEELCVECTWMPRGESAWNNEKTIQDKVPLSILGYGNLRYNIRAIASTFFP